MTVIHALPSQFPKWDSWRMGVTACVTLPGEGGNSAHRARGPEPPTSLLQSSSGSWLFLSFLCNIRFHWELEL